MGCGGADVGDLDVGRPRRGVVTIVTPENYPGNAIEIACKITHLKQLIVIIFTYS